MKNYYVGCQSATEAKAKIKYWNNYYKKYDKVRYFDSVEQAINEFMAGITISNYNNDIIYTKRCDGSWSRRVFFGGGSVTFENAQAKLVYNDKEFPNLFSVVYYGDIETAMANKDEVEQIYTKDNDTNDWVYLELHSKPGNGYNGFENAEDLQAITDIVLKGCKNADTVMVNYNRGSDTISVILDEVEFLLFDWEIVGIQILDGTTILNHCDIDNYNDLNNVVDEIYVYWENERVSIEA